MYSESLQCRKKNWGRREALSPDLGYNNAPPKYKEHAFMLKNFFWLPLSRLWGLRFSGTSLFPHTVQEAWVHNYMSVQKITVKPHAEEVNYFGIKPVGISLSYWIWPKILRCSKRSLHKARRVQLISTGCRTNPNSTIYHLEFWMSNGVFPLNSIPNSVKRTLPGVFIASLFLSII